MTSPKNSIPPPRRGFPNIQTRVRPRFCRHLGIFLSISMLGMGSVHATPVSIGDVVQTVLIHQNRVDLRLADSLSTGPSSVPAKVWDNGFPDRSPAALKLNTVFSTAGTSSVGQSFTSVEVQDDLRATITDCGEVTVAAGTFPKWPMLFLTGIPLLFLHGCTDCVSVAQPRSPSISFPSPPTQTIESTRAVPEPAPLLLFGSGLAVFGAISRRRYARKKLEILSGEEV